MNQQTDTTDIINLGLLIRGEFTNTGFRFSTMKEAYHIGIKGIVKNTEEGSIYIEAEGKKNQLDQFTDWCNSMKKEISISQIQISENEVKHYKEFNII